MKYPKIMLELISNSWAMTNESFSGILNLVELGYMNEEEYIYHAASSTDKINALIELGELEGNAKYTRIKGKIGTLFIDGPIIPRGTSLSDASGLTAVDALTKEFRELEANEKINDIVLMLDTPGGIVQGVSDFAKIVAASKKRVTAYVLGMAASAGYWIASAADKIVSTDTGIIGNIGTVLTVETKKDSDKVEIVSSQSPRKRPDVTTKQGRRDVQAIVDDLADVFIEAVAKNRNVTKSKVMNRYGKGAAFVAAEALKRGMIDRISTLGELVESLKNENVFSGQATLEVAALGATFEGTSQFEQNKQKAIHPAGVVTKTKEDRMSTLAELMAEDSTLAKEVEALKKEAYAEGVASEKTRINAVIPFLSNEEYPRAVMAIACRVLNGELGEAALHGAVGAIDMMKAQGNLKTAQGETGEIGDTPPQTEPAISEDGSINNEEDFEAAVAAARAN